LKAPCLFTDTWGFQRSPVLSSQCEQRNDYDWNRLGGPTSWLTPLHEATLDDIGFTWIFGGTKEEYAPTMEYRLDEVRSGTKSKGDNNGVAVPASITSW
jgi:hypothetical protein